MPQITKIRIVNFRYNNSNRLIADELFDLTDTKNNAVNTLFSMENGTGKTILVHLMLQPIIPMAKVSGRNIRDSFIKAADHSFIMLEMTKDYSDEKLMIGIAISASNASINDDDTRGKSVKYYTFYSEYKEKSNFDIQSLPLSRKENGSIAFESFDGFRKYINSNKGNIHYYHSDDSYEWRQKLEEFGIYETEWRTIEKLNSEEDGLGKYFDNFKSSTAIIDKLLIKTIEEKIEHGRTDEDSSLTSILLAYVNQYDKNKENIKEKDALDSFVEELKDVSNNTEQLLSLADEIHKRIGELFTFLDLMYSEKRDAEEEIENLQHQQEKIQETIQDIKWEKASKEYYLAEDEYAVAKSEHNNLEEEKKTVENELSLADHHLKAIECSKYFKEVKEENNNIEVLTKQIEEKENDSQQGKLLSSLKYSLRKIAEEQLPVLNERFENESTTRNDLYKKQDELEKLSNSAEKNRQTNKTRLDKVSGQLSYITDENDAKVKELGLNITRYLDGLYNDEELHKCLTARTNALSALLRNESNIEETIGKKESRKYEISETIPELNTSKAKAEDEIDSIRKEIDIYGQIEKEIEKITIEYSLDYSLRFTDIIKRTLEENKDIIISKKRKSEQELELVKDSIEAIKKGSLHIPKTITQYLDSLGIDYQPVEKYLLNQIDKGTLGEQECLSLLNDFPAFAYGIMIENDEVASLNQDRANWLPAVLPVYNMDTVKSVLDHSYAQFDSIAYFSEDYFTNHQTYLDKINSEKEKIEQQITAFDNSISSIENQEKTVDSFSNYDEHWKEKQEQSVSELIDKYHSIEKQIEDLKVEKQSLDSDIKNLRIEEKENNNNINITKNWIEQFNKTLLVGLQKESETRTEKQECEYRCIESEKEVIRLNKEKADLANSLDNVVKSIDGINSQIEEIKKTYNEISNCAIAEITTGDWEDLILQYNETKNAMNSDIQVLQEKIKNAVSNKKRAEEEIKNRGLLEEAYNTIVYSKDEEDKAHKYINTLKESSEEADEKERAALIRSTKAEQRYNNAKSALVEFGDEPKQKAEISDNFDYRIKECNQALKDNEKKKKDTETKSNEIQRVTERCEDYLRDYKRPDVASPIGQILDRKEFFDERKKEINELSKKRDNLHQTTLASIKQIGESHRDGFADSSKITNSLITRFSNKTDYFTIALHVSEMIKSCELLSAKIDTDLKDFANVRTDLINQTFLRGKQIYDGLIQMCNGSRAEVYSGKNQHMIKLNLPQSIDEIAAKGKIADELDEATKKLVSYLNGFDSSDKELAEKASKELSSAKALRWYIRQDHIELKAYKIDQNPENAGYRTWEQLRVQNSGAEKFIDYFAIILAIMNYARKEYEGQSEKGLTSTLILDNPFGRTSSYHILAPMFRMAKKFNIQLICLSDIKQTDVIKCFDNVIKAVVKQNKYSNVELLTHEGNEKIEHGFYKSEQIGLF